MSKKSLTNGVALKVRNRSGFDKSRFNALTTGVGTLTPIVKQLLIPSSGKLSIKVSAQLPPLASDAYLRSHLKLEAFAVPMRLCYGGFESWLCGREVYDANNDTFLRAELPYAALSGSLDFSTTVTPIDPYGNPSIGPGSLHDYLGVNFSWNSARTGFNAPVSQVSGTVDFSDGSDQTATVQRVNIFPYIAYQLIYDEWYRNKLVERPLFAPPTARTDQGFNLESTIIRAYNLPFVSSGDLVGVWNGDNYDEFEEYTWSTVHPGYIASGLLNGSLYDLRQRNYGDDYFTAATPNLQEGSAASIDTSGGSFTIAALRLQNSMQEFKEANNYASPDYIQTNIVRWGVGPSAGVAQKPILLGSADFPMYTSGVEQTSLSAGSTANPFTSVGARYGSAHAEGTDFVCDFDVKEPSYLIVLASLVPEATYSNGLDHDMQLLTQTGSVVDLPCAQFENIGNEPIYKNEIVSSGSGVFGYAQRYLWHKLGHQNEVHGLFKSAENLGSFVVQRSFASAPSLSSYFLKVQRTDLDNVAAVSGDISKFGVMIDSRIDLFVSEPLSDSSIPSLSDPAKEHGHSVYVKTGGSKLS